MPEPGFLKASKHSANNRAFLDADTGQWFTRGQLSDHVNAFAAKLSFAKKALGFNFAFNNSSSLIAYLAAVEAGHAIVLLNPEMDAEFKHKLIEIYQPDFIVAPPSHPPETGDVYSNSESPYPDQLLLRARDPHKHTIHPNLTLLNSTSGSTGSPKLVRLTWRNLESNARQLNQVLSNSEEDCMMVTAPIFNAFGQSVVHTHLLAGGSFVLTRERIVSRTYWDYARAAGCNSIGGTPFFYQTLDRLDLDSLDVPALKKFIASGGRLAEHLVIKFHRAAVQRGGALHVMYGQAETTARMAGLPPQYLPDAARSIGFALPGGRLQVEREGSQCAPLEEGELVYEGPSVMMGYAREASDLEAGDLMGGRIATGDLGYQDERGLLYITGRKARFAKLFGWRISLDDVEEMLSHTGPVAALNQDDRIIVYTERKSPEFSASIEQLPARLRIHPSAFEVRAVEHIPILANGKTNYSSLALA